jgi:hypothetical protein
MSGETRRRASGGAPARSPKQITRESKGRPE